MIRPKVYLFALYVYILYKIEPLTRVISEIPLWMLLLAFSGASCYIGYSVGN